MREQVKFMPGIGAEAYLSMPATEDKKAVNLDLLVDAEWIISYGLTVPCPPPPTADEVAATLTMDMGENGRCMWISGGRDLSETEFAQAFAAGFDLILGHNSDDKLFDKWVGRLHYRLEKNLIKQLEGLISAKALKKKRKKFGGRSAVDLYRSDNNEDWAELILWISERIWASDL